MTAAPCVSHHAATAEDGEGHLSGHQSVGRIGKVLLVELLIPCAKSRDDSHHRACQFLRVFGAEAAYVLQCAVTYPVVNHTEIGLVHGTALATHHAAKPIAASVKEWLQCLLAQHFGAAFDGLHAEAFQCGKP